MWDLKKQDILFHFALFLFLILFTLVDVSQALAGGDRNSQKINALNDQNRLLEAEAGLASTGTAYILLELQPGADSSPVRINLKNRGIVLREFEARRMRYRRTKTLASEPTPLLKKKAFFSGRRKEIRPRKAEDRAETSVDLDFLEVRDMPSSYTLLFERGRHISVTGQPKGFLASFVYLIRSVLTHIRHSLTIVWNLLQKRESAIIEIMMAQEEAQSFFWSLEKGMSILIIERAPPGSV